MTLPASSIVSLTLHNQSGKIMKIQNTSNPFEIRIPHQSNRLMPPMVRENVTSSSKTISFNYHYVNLTHHANLALALHIDLKPENVHLSYLFIIRFSDAPDIQSNLIDERKLLCPKGSSISCEYPFEMNFPFRSRKSFVNLQTIHQQYSHISSSMGHYWYSWNEWMPWWSSIWSHGIFIGLFHSNLFIGLFVSGRTQQLAIGWINGKKDLISLSCSPIDSNQVGSKTNERFIQCYSTHLTTYAGGFLVLPNPISWNQSFDFKNNITIYTTLIILALLYMATMGFSHYKDRIDAQMVTSFIPFVFLCVTIDWFSYWLFLSLIIINWILIYIN